jgi:hypothetical protein
MTSIEVVRAILVTCGNRVEKSLVFLTRHRAVQVRAFLAGAFHGFLAITRGAENDVVVNGLERYDGRDRVIERQRVASRSFANRLRQAFRGQRTGGDDRRTPYVRDLVANNLDHRVTRDPLRNQPRKRVPVHRERRAARNPGCIGAFEHHAAQDTHLGFQQAVGVGRFGALEGV